MRRVRRPLRRRRRAAARWRASRVVAGCRPDRAGTASVPGEIGSMAFIDSFEDLGGLKQLPGHRCAAVHGRRLRIRWGRGLEDVSAGPHRQGHERGPSWWRVVHGGLHLRLRCRRRPSLSGPTCWRSVPTIAAGQPSCEIHPLFVGEREDPVRLVFTGAAGPGVVVGMCDMGNRLRLVANEIDAIASTGGPPGASGGRALWEPRPTSRQPRSRGCWRAARTTRPTHRRSDSRPSRTSLRWSTSSW